MIGDINMPGMDWNRRMADSRGRDFLRAVEEEMSFRLMTFFDALYFNLSIV
jgi:hypothetical protein